jgi:hypothetical protein
MFRPPSAWIVNSVFILDEHNRKCTTKTLSIVMNLYMNKKSTCLTPKGPKFQIGFFEILDRLIQCQQFLCCFSHQTSEKKKIATISVYFNLQATSKIPKSKFLNIYPYNTSIFLRKVLVCSMFIIEGNSMRSFFLLANVISFITNNISS